MTIPFDIKNKNDYKKIFIDPPISTVHWWHSKKRYASKFLGWHWSQSHKNVIQNFLGGFGGT